jgi:hypothetical protein
VAQELQPKSLKIDVGTGHRFDPSELANRSARARDGFCRSPAECNPEEAEERRRTAEN